MGFLDFLKGPDFDQGITECKSTPGAILLDVRTPQEYREGHIHGSINAPLQSLGKAEAVSIPKGTPLFVYCHSGARSSQAVRLLGQMGYTHAKNIGGIAAYKGEVEH